MPIRRHNNHNDFIVIDFIDKAVFLSDTPTPTSCFVSFQQFRFTSARTWMFF